MKEVKGKKATNRKQRNNNNKGENAKNKQQRKASKAKRARLREQSPWYKQAKEKAKNGNNGGLG